MTDVNEEIVRIYFELNNYLVRTNLVFLVKREKSSGYSDIDLAIYNQENDEKAIVEVKGWHGTHFTPSDLKAYENQIFKFVKPEALQVAKTFFKTSDFKKFLVISKLPRTENARKESLKIIESYGIDKVFFFKDILRYVVSQVKENINYRDSEFLQTIRLMKIYGFLKNK